MTVILSSLCTFYYFNYLATLFSILYVSKFGNIEVDHFLWESTLIYPFYGLINMVWEFGKLVKDLFPNF